MAREWRHRGETVRVDPIEDVVFEQTGIRCVRPVVVGQHRRGTGWVRTKRRTVLTQATAEHLADSGVDSVMIRRHGRRHEIRLPRDDLRDGPRVRRSTFVSVWDSIARP